VANFSNRILPTTANSKRKYLDRVTIALVLIWICFLLFVGKQIQPAEHLVFIQAYSKNLGILLLDKVACFIQLNISSFIQ
jgi:hypothetical protein